MQTGLSGQRNVVRVFCNKCCWSPEPHATGMKAHLSAAHPEEEEAAVGEEVEEIVVMPPLKKCRQVPLEHAFDKMLTATEQETAVQALAMAAVASGWSHNSLQTKECHRFFHMLRPGFRLVLLFLIRFFDFAFHNGAAPILSTLGPLLAGCNQQAV